MVQVFTTDNFSSEVLQSSIPVMVDFYADWCGPCKMMAPVVEQLSEEYEGKVKVGKLNIDEQMEIAGQYSVMTIPTIMIFKDGKAVAKTIGVQTKNVLADELNALL